MGRLFGAVLLLLGFAACSGSVSLYTIPLGGAPGGPPVDAAPPPTAFVAAARPSATPVTGGDPARGEKLFARFQPLVGMACTNCHLADSEQRLVGPGLLNVAQRAATNIDQRLTRRGISPTAPDRVDRYLRAAITDPTGYVLPGYTDIMPKTWGKALTEQQLDDLIAYLRTLKG